MQAYLQEMYETCLQFLKVKPHKIFPVYFSTKLKSIISINNHSPYLVKRRLQTGLNKE